MNNQSTQLPRYPYGNSEAYSPSEDMYSLLPRMYYDMNGLADSLHAIHIDTFLYTEYTTTTALSPFMGMSHDNVIIQAEKRSGEGIQTVMPFINALSTDSVVRGDQQLRGNEEKLETKSDTVMVECIRGAIPLHDKTLLNISTPINLSAHIRPLLLQRAQKVLVLDLLKAATEDLYPANSNNVYDKGPADSRCLYAGVGYRPTINEGMKAMTGATYDKSGLSYRHIVALADLAKRGGRVYDQEYQIQPASVSQVNGFPASRFVYLITPKSFRSLAQDPIWSAFYQRGIIESGQPSAIRGATFRGEIEGVQIIEVQELEKYSKKVVNNAGVEIEVSHNLLLGAQAFYVTWAQRSKMIFDGADYKKWQFFGLEEYRGQTALKLSGKRNPNIKVERGIIHSFVQTDDSLLNNTYDDQSNTNSIEDSKVTSKTKAITTK